MDRRIFGIENEYGVTCMQKGQRRLSPDETARYLFRRVVTWGRSSNVFLENGARLYLDVGSHPEYATPECANITDVITHDKAGERLLNELVATAQERLGEEGIRGDIFVFKNNIDSAGNSYGCHENYLTSRRDDFAHYSEILIPFLVTRQVFAGAGRILTGVDGKTQFTISQRAEYIWEGVSSATTRSRPIINTRDEPHADAERFRRLHVIVGDSNMSEYAAFLKVGTMALMLRMLEDGDVPLRDFTLENPVEAIRAISNDLSCNCIVKLANGTTIGALDIQDEYLTRALAFRDQYGLNEEESRVLDLWQHVMQALRNDPLSLSRECDWVMKYHLLDRFRTKANLDWNAPELALMDLRYHDIDPRRGLFYRIQARDMTERICNETAIDAAMTTAPSTTRAHLRGQFIRAAKEKQRDYTVDWVHLKINDNTQRTVLCKDPFKHADARVARLIEEL